MSEKPRVRRARVWVTWWPQLREIGSVYFSRDDARFSVRIGGDQRRILPATLTWTEPAPKRKPRHDR